MMMTRFAGGCERFAAVDITELRAWIAAIDFAQWPQQNKPGAPIKPAMVTDLGWHGFGVRCAPVVAALMGHFPGGIAYQRMLSVVMPGQSIPPHCDGQDKAWLARVHVPLTTNERSAFIVAGAAHALVPGLAYRDNTEVEHAVTNDGATPRIHFMFDVRTS